MLIGLFAPKGQFGVLDFWASSLKREFELLGHCVVLIHQGEEFLLLERYHFDFTISLNLPPRILFDDVWFFEFHKRFHIMFLVDHPFDTYFFLGLKTPPSYLFVTVVCATFIDDLVFILKHPRELCCVLFHAIEDCEVDNSSDRSLSAFTVTSFHDEGEVWSHAFRVLPRWQFDLISILALRIEEEKFKPSCGRVLLSALRDFLDLENDINFTYIVLRSFLEKYISRRKRRIFLKCFGELNVDCFGPIPPENLRREAPCWSWKGEIPFIQTLFLFERYKMFLNVQRDTIEGTHERFLYAVDRGCSVISEETTVYRGFSLGSLCFWNGESTQDLTKINKDQVSGKVFFENQKLLSSFKWSFRAQQMLDIYKKHSKYLLKQEQTNS